MQIDTMTDAEVLRYADLEHPNDPWISRLVEIGREYMEGWENAPDIEEHEALERANDELNAELNALRLELGTMETYVRELQDQVANMEIEANRRGDQ